MKPFTWVFHAWKRISIHGKKIPYGPATDHIPWQECCLCDQNFIFKYQREQIWVILYSWLYKLPSKISCGWYRYRTSFTIFPAIYNSFIRGCEHFRNIPISCKVSFRLPGKPFFSIHGFFFHVWKKNSMHGKKFPCMEMLDEGLQCFI